MEPAFGYCTGAARGLPDLLHLRRPSRARTLCKLPCGPMLPGPLQRSLLGRTCGECAARYAKLLAAATRAPKGPSALEEAFRFQLEALQLPRFEREFEFATEALGRGWRFDFAWPAYKVAAEIDGGLWIAAHRGHRGPAQIEQDMVRNAAAALLGWRVFRGSPDLVHSGILAEWVELALAQAAGPQEPRQVARLRFPNVDRMREIRWENARASGRLRGRR